MTSPTATRRDRRAEERQRARQADRQRRSNPRRGWRSPFVLATAGAAIVGILIIGTLIVVSGAKPHSADIQPSGVLPPAASLVHGRTVGDPNAPITIDLWSDFQCPVCDQFATTIEPRLRTSYVADGRVKMVYHDLAFLGQESVDAAVAARIADAQGGAFWTYHDLLYANQGQENSGTFNRDRLADIAVVAGLDRAAFTAAFADTSYVAAVSKETGQGGAAGINQTPTLVINGKVYAGLPLWPKLTAVLDDLAAASPAPSGSATPASSTP